MRGINEFTKRQQVDEEVVITASPLMKHIYFYQEFKPLEIELLCFLMEHGGKNYSMAEISVALGHPEGWGTNFSKAMKALEKREYVSVTREHRMYHTYDVTDKFRRMFTV